MSRKSKQTRTTNETDVSVNLNLDGSGSADIQTGIGFLDHMYTALCVHAGLDLQIRCQGDLEVDDHHTAEDTALMLGAAFDSALGERKGIQRFIRSPFCDGRFEVAPTQHRSACMRKPQPRAHFVCHCRPPDLARQSQRW